MNYWKYRPPESVRQLLLDYVISDEKGTSLSDSKSSTNISKSNWQNSADNIESNRKFALLFEEYYFNDYANFLYEKVKRKFDWTNVWYQIYKNNSNSCHDFHNHYPRVSVANVFYLELKSSNLLTEFKNDDGTLSKPDAKEGDTIIFDPTKYHRSPPNNTNNRKIIISFNVLFL